MNRQKSGGNVQLHKLSMDALHMLARGADMVNPISSSFEINP